MKSQPVPQPLVAAAAVLLLTAGLQACGRADDPHGLDSPRSPHASVESRTPQYADADRDGRVTRAEAQRDPKLAASFNRYDRDNSGDLDRGEFARLEAGATLDSEAETADKDRAAPLRPREEFPRGKP